MSLSSVQKGNLIESQIANMLILQSNGEISPSIPIVDDNGIDLILNLKNSFNTIFIQVKSRFVTNSKYKNRLDFQIDKNKLNLSEKFFILCVYFDQVENQIDSLWLIPSKEIKINAIELKKFYRIVASRNPESNDKWSKYKVNPKVFIDKVKKILLSE